MTEDRIITDDDIEKASGCLGTLGPHYFTARRVAEEFMAPFEAEHFKPLIDKFSKDFNEKLWDGVREWLKDDTERNIQSAIWRTVDDIMKGVVSGEKWIADRYALGERYDCEKARETLARHIPKELQDMRISDLEEKIKSLEESLRWARRD